MSDRLSLNPPINSLNLSCIFNLKNILIYQAVSSQQLLHPHNQIWLYPRVVNLN